MPDQKRSFGILHRLVLTQKCESTLDFLYADIAPAVPTMDSLASDKLSRVFFRNLCLFRQANWLIALAKTWFVYPPQPNKQYTRLAGNFIFKPEIAHLKGVGTFANEAWRIFCKESFHKHAINSTLIPEWKKVVQTDRGLVV